MWHSRNSLRYANVLGPLACRVTSKILGIGSAERSWGDVKHLKTNKSAHLYADRVKNKLQFLVAIASRKATSRNNFLKMKVNRTSFGLMKTLIGVLMFFQMMLLPIQANLQEFLRVGKRIGKKKLCLRNRL